jgi:hypothetical protein
MSKIFVNENPQGLAPPRTQLAQAHDDFGTLVDRIRDRKSPRAVVSKSQHDPIAAIGGAIVLGALGLAVYFWHREIFMVAAVLVLFGTFTRSPLLAIGGALLMLSLAR